MRAIYNVKRFVKPKLIRIVSIIRQPFVRALNASGLLYCPICESNVHTFLPAGNPPRPHARCPVCNSLERHRLDWMLFRNMTDLFDGSRKKMLHIAPERFLSEQFRRIDNLDYLSADINWSKAMLQMDITDINYPDNSFSIIYCSHVLEHIPNDLKAIAELYRVLCQGGWAVLQVPITVEQTYENPAITEPEERKVHYGQSDHVRRCGPDYAERIRDAGFSVQVLQSTDVVTTADCERMGFQPDRYIFFCKKPSLNNMSFVGNTPEH